MVVLSAAILTRNGRVLVARQFVGMSRIRVEGLLAAFPKLVGGADSQHTFVETESVRYVYQSMEGLYLVLITNRASNIIEDLETLRLLSKVVPDLAPGLTEAAVWDASFDLVFALDEVLTTGGYREPISLSQIRTNMDMDSHEEKLHNMIKASKIESAKDEMVRQERVIRARKRDEAMGSGSGGMAGIGSDSYGGGDGLGGGGGGYDSGGMGRPGSAGDGMGMGGGGGGGYNTGARPGSGGGSGGGTSAPARPAASGMKLGGSRNTANSLLSQVAAEDKIKLADVAPRGGAGAEAGGADGVGGDAAAAAAAASAVAPTASHPVSLEITEKLTVVFTRDGSLEQLEVKGILSLTAATPEASMCRIALQVENPYGVTFQAHPKIDKRLFDSDRVLSLRDPSKGFPTDRAVGVLRWRHSSTDESHAPLRINCWPEEESRGVISVNIEYSLERAMTLHDVEIVIPLGAATGPPSIVAVDGNHKHSSRDNTLTWSIPMIDNSNASGTLEFTIPSRDTEGFFPITLGFSSRNLYLPTQIVGVSTADQASSIEFSQHQLVTADDYRID